MTSRFKQGPSPAMCTCGPQDPQRGNVPRGRLPKARRRRAVRHVARHVDDARAGTPRVAAGGPPHGARLLRQVHVAGGGGGWRGGGERGGRLSGGGGGASDRGAAAVGVCVNAQRSLSSDGWLRQVRWGVASVQISVYIWCIACGKFKLAGWGEWDGIGWREMVYGPMVRVPCRRMRVTGSHAECGSAAHGVVTSLHKRTEETNGGRNVRKKGCGVARGAGRGARRPYVRMGRAWQVNGVAAVEAGRGAGGR